MAEEIRAQARGGYRTGLVQVNSRLLGSSRGMNPLLRRCIEDGLADLLSPDEIVETDLLILRHPTLFQEIETPLPRISARLVLLVANQAATDGAGIQHYDPARANQTVAEVFGRRPLWAPIGPAVRDSLRSWVDEIDLNRADWLNVIDADEWAADRSTFVGTTPTIGRHSRPQESKWPESPHELLAAYPDSNEFRVRILGGARAARLVLGRVPSRWLVEEFGARSPRQFLADIDFFVYFHRSDLVEAYGRTIMEAMASGAVVILPSHFQRTFGDAAIYANATEVQDIVRHLYADRPAYLAQAERGHTFVRKTHDHQVHLDRLEELLGRRSTTPAYQRVAPSRQATKSRVMFMSSNGAGMGHLTRLLAMAVRASNDIEPFFLSLSQAVPVVEKYGFRWEYCPSRGDLQVSPGAWNKFFRERFRDLLRRYRPDALVFDGTWPYPALVRLRPQFPDVIFVWARRGMWRPELGGEQLTRAEIFDLIIEPGELAATADRGPTAHRSDALRVAPITLIDTDQLLSAMEARDELGLDTARPAALVALGAGNINDITSDLSIVLSTLSTESGWQISVTKPPIAEGSNGDQNFDVHRLSVYPLARYLRAFDFAVAASGYNSYHELIAAGVPTAFVPNLQTAADDQLARATYAEEQGVGLCLADLTSKEAVDRLRAMLDLSTRMAMRERAQSLATGNGAGNAMKAVEQLLIERRARNT